MSDEKDIDRSCEADAKRFRWLIDGNGYFMEENSLCHFLASDKEKDEARKLIDETMEQNQ